MKEELRAHLKKIRDSISAEHRAQGEKEIKNYFIKWLEGQSFSCVGGYYPIHSEMNVLPILQFIERLGIIVCLPITVGDILAYREWKIGANLYKKGKLLEPDLNAKVIIPDLLIIPLLGFDREGHRIGYGKGFYDRYMKENRIAVKIGITFSSQEIKNQSPFEEHDEKLDYIITELGIIKC